ncbi:MULTISPECIES: hypothetical protein [unclassified Clostridium]|uniref:Uncharacterized protein n=1 Tax=Clostridium aquiflavi TaxID=3073603 RepID=A0ABU1EFX4_9CLOT|nr:MULTISPECIES: hypothetical protein [unclassified Clostridium]MDR5587286.1 hypothetical protein [Clostridium sp. 5N-1]
MANNTKKLYRYMYLREAITMVVNDIELFYSLISNEICSNFV